MPTHIIDADNFKLKINLKIYESDIQLPVNTTMSISVTSGNFSASSNMDIDIKQFALFSKDLKGIYEDLNGTAKIEEPYGCHQYISFTAIKGGHIVVQGYLCDDLQENEIFFNNEFDQTIIKTFADELVYSYLKYYIE